MRLAEGVPVLVQTHESEGFAPRPAEVKKAIGPRTRAVIVNSPCNPTGAVWPRQALQGVVDAVRGTEILVITDDIDDILFSACFLLERPAQ